MGSLAAAYLLGNATAKPIDRALKKTGEKLFLKPAKEIVNYFSPGKIEIYGKVIGVKDHIVYVSLKDGHIKDKKNGGIFKNGCPVGDGNGRIGKIYSEIAIYVDGNNKYEIGKSYSFEVGRGEPTDAAKAYGNGNWWEVPLFYKVNP